MVTLPPELLDAPELALYQEQIQARLTEESRLRRNFHDELSPDTKAEFIHGEVIVHSPAATRHTRTRMHLSRLLSTYVEARQLGLVLDEKALVSLSRNDYEPDIVFYGVEKASRIEPGQLLFPAPDFVAEVLSESTAHRDRGVKFRDYAAHGVREYWLIDPQSETLEQHELINSSYALRVKSGSGVAQSFTVRGFEIPIRAVFDGQENLRALREILGQAQASE